MISNGIDLVEIKRIEKSLENGLFCERVYGENERKQIVNKSNPIQSFAGAFAAKEAFSKALGTGIRGFSLNEVQVMHDDGGRPYFELSGKALEIVTKRKIQLSLSITHTEKYAAAVVTAVSEE